MTRSRQWYEDVMDVALRATLKEFGFKRRSRTNYVCEHSPDRVWVFEIEPWRQHHPFRDWTGIFVPEIEDIVTRIAPEIGTYATFLRNPAHLRASIAELVKIEHGWDQATWERSPKSRHWLWGQRFSPRVTLAVPLFDGNWWNQDHVKEVLVRKRSVQEFVRRSAGISWHERLSRDNKETAEAVGRELDFLWRKYSHDWLRRCDDPRYLAEWLNTYVFSGKYTPLRSTYAATAATAYHMAGDQDGAASVLNRLIAELETAFETELARKQARDRTPGPIAQWVRGLIGHPTPPPREHNAEARAWAKLDVKRENAEAARKLAAGLGIKL